MNLQLLNHEAAHLALARIFGLEVVSFQLNYNDGCVTVTPHPDDREYTRKWLMMCMGGRAQDGEPIGPHELNEMVDGDLGTVAILARFLGLGAVEFLQVEAELERLRATPLYKAEMRRACDDLREAAGW